MRLDGSDEASWMCGLRLKLYWLYMWHDTASGEHCLVSIRFRRQRYDVYTCCKNPKVHTNWKYCAASESPEVLVISRVPGRPAGFHWSSRKWDRCVPTIPCILRAQRAVCCHSGKREDLAVHKRKNSTRKIQYHNARSPHKVKMFGFNTVGTKMDWRGRCGCNCGFGILHSLPQCS